MAETNSRKSACSPNISKGTMKEERESTRNQDSIKIIIYPSDDFVSLHSGEDLMKKHLGNGQNGETYSKTGEIESLFTEKSRAETHEHISENSSILPKPLIFDQNSMHYQSTINNAKINQTHPSEEKNTLETLPFSSGMEERNRESISKEFPNSSHTSETSECFVILHDNLKPQIRKNYPSPTRPRNNTDKKEKPKSKKDVILPSPKDKEIPKIVECMKNSKSSEEGAKDNRTTNKDESTTEDNGREKIRPKFLIEKDKLKLDDNNSRSTEIGEAIDDVGKNDLEDLIFNYRSKPKHWREQWEITYEDETNSNPREICERMKLADEIKNREVFEKIEVTKANHGTCKTTLPTSHNPIYEVTPNEKTGKKELNFFKISKDRHSKKSGLIKKSQTENTSELIVSGELEHEGNTEPQLISLESSKNAGGMYPAKHDYANPNQLKNEKTKAVRSISPNPVKIHTRNDVNVMNLDNIPNKKSQIQEGADEPMILKERKWPPKLKKSKTSYGKLHQKKSPSQEISKIKLSKKKILVPNKTLCSSNLLEPSGTLKVSDGNAPNVHSYPKKIN
ncbi:hypothetical protein JTB14_032026 [Gonioctena quinquepunctata]|nr:hypothetical protein JTB14_032026 [Gonioctena quinquepunctata]